MKEDDLMIVTEDDINKYKLIKPCDICGKTFRVGKSYEKITTHGKSKLIIHKDCIKKGWE
jgi:hypothetical protein